MLIIIIYHKIIIHIRLSLRQSGSCSVNSDCYPSGINGSVPSRLIECDNNVCVCSECFTANTTGRCTFTIISPSDCYPYNSGTGTCTDNRKSQLVTFLLSLFLSGFGVANFYIGQNGLGAGQLVLTLSIIVVSCFAICVPICLCCCLQSDNEGAALCVSYIDMYRLFYYHYNNYIGWLS